MGVQSFGTGELMAPITRNLLVQDGGAFTVDYTYDNVTLRILSVKVVNLSAASYYVSAKSTATEKLYSFVIPPGTIEQAIPQTVANRLQLSVRPSGRLDGVEWSIY